MCLDLCCRGHPVSRRSRILAPLPERRSAVPNTVLVTREPPIAVVQLNRPDVLNALNEEVLGELVTALGTLDDDGEIRCIVLTGNERTFAEKAPVAARLATEAVDLAWNSTLDAGLEFERKAFYLLFATEDKKEGVDAFVNKRKPTFKGK